MTQDPAMQSELDYPVANPDDIAAVIFRAMLIQAMALRYMKSVPDLSLDDGMASAIATWETEWDEHPKPRTMEMALAEVDSDLQYWTEE